MNAFVAERVSGKLQALNVLDQRTLEQRLKVPVSYDRVFNGEDADTWLQRTWHRKKHVEKSVLLVFFKEEVKVDGQSVHVLVVVQDFLEERVLVLREEPEGLPGYLQLLRSLKELHCP